MIDDFLLQILDDSNVLLDKYHKEFVHYYKMPGIHDICVG